ncbi:MAG: SDR family oxidoreductase [Syntrophomonadaceae bacterium]|nr:SDR family oxidoreductase [Dysgonamonadaceae bacterium]MDD3901437.1 SDR family oxidoreductase [Dysgonamonadaceae bacterium]MDD4550303.1 SDR family oxidoreductase [Syntrophomonadaceae bacterium]
MNKRGAAVITGGSKGIGREISIKLASKYNILIVYKSDHVSAQETVDYVTSNGGYATSISADMTNIIEIETVTKMAVSQFGEIDVLVNNIGKNIPCSLNDITPDIWNQVIDCNLKSMFFSTKIIGKEMMKNREGVVINISSTAGIQPLPESPPYIAAKAGVIALTKYFAQVYAPIIRVNAIAPGYVLTENHKPENYSKYENVIKRIPINRMANLSEIADAVFFLTENAKYITGQTLVLDGGLCIN